MRAFILEPTEHDVTGVKKFGEIVYLYEAGERRVSMWDEDCAFHIVERLRNHAYDPADDCIVVSGRVVPMAVFIAAVAGKYGAIDLLLHDARYREYVLRRVKC